MFRKRDDVFHYPADKHPYIIDLMKKFQLCYSIDDEMILVPDLLEVQEPEIDFDYDNTPASGARRTDAEYFMGIGYAFKF